MNKEPLPDYVKEYIDHQIENDEINRWFCNLPFDDKLKIKQSHENALPKVEDH